jgi:hypothetical protein
MTARFATAVGGVKRATRDLRRHLVRFVVTREPQRQACPACELDFAPGLTGGACPICGNAAVPAGSEAPRTADLLGTIERASWAVGSIIFVLVAYALYS